MMEARPDWAVVKAVYPEAFIKKETTYGKAELFTVHDPISGRFVGPTAFSEEAAWKHAAERLERDGGVSNG
jgi:hypothetical protein